VEDHRSTDQVFREDFMLLWPQHFIGTADGFFAGDCIDSPGTYEFSASYYPSSLDASKVHGVPSVIDEYGKQLLAAPGFMPSDKVDSAPLRITILPRAVRAKAR
jgi:hypothetical protein